MWCKIENNELIFPPKYDKESSLFNCDLNEEWLIRNRIFKMVR